MMPQLLRVLAAVAPVHREPGVTSEQVSQYLFGHLLHESASQGPWRHVRGADDYSGWVHEGYLGADPDPDAWRAAGFSLGCLVRTAAGSTAIPFGALVPASVEVAEGEVVPETERTQRFPATGEAVARSARDLFSGTSYLWGGVTPWGADCSGFTQAVFALHGIALPRDASQQGKVGLAAGDDPLACVPGELLFFSDRQDGAVTHVAIALGGGSVAHCALGRGGKRVEHLRAPDWYTRELLRHFRFARRVCAAR